MDLLEQRQAAGFLAWIGAANFYSLVAAEKSRAEARSFLLDLVAFVEVAPTTTESLRQAGRFGLSDLEDAMQVAAGLACSADVIATRDARDYRGAPIEALPTEAVVARIARSR